MDKERLSLLIFSQRFPPGIGGTPTVMGNLCSTLPKDRIHVVSLGERGESLNRTQNDDLPHTRLVHPGKLRRKIDPAFFSIIPKVMKEARKASKGTGAILAVYPSTCFMLSAYYFSKKHKLPFYPYFMDTWTEGRGHQLERSMASYYEPRLMEHAAKVFVLTPALEQFFGNKYPRIRNKIQVLPHSIQNPELQPSADDQWSHEGLHIVYTGQVYGPTVDPIQLLLKSFDQLKELNPLLTISSPDSLHALTTYGLVNNPKVRLVCLDSSQQVGSLQASADILFNPVSFERKDNLQVKTLFPTKTIEYLRARRPMIVCGPDNTAFVSYAKEKQFGYVVDQNDPTVLASYCRTIFEGNTLTQVEVAGEEELAGRDSKLIAQSLWNEIGLGR